ncbi:MAG: hypothetical protein KDD62_03735 [Bdellovibrionales bacterium]|nr:hypothetical protein [Bdellovibrionales bacterium]
MNNEQLTKLFGSLKTLETTIENVYERLASKENVSDKVLERVASYRKICDMQKRFSIQLEQKLGEKKYEEVARLVKLINGLSAMIMDDARLILSGIELEKDDFHYC